MPTAPLAGPLFDSWRAGPADSNVSVVHEPATGEPLDAYRNATSQEVAAAVEKVDSALSTWGRTTQAERAALLLTLADRLEAAGEDFARSESANVGKPLAPARDEIAYDADVLRWMAGACRISHASAAGEYVEGGTSMTRRAPLGVVGLITPRNYPLMEAMWKVAPAVAAGHTVVLKPSELTPLSTILFAQLAHEVLPDGVLNLVLGDGTIGAALVEHPTVRLVSWTGDVATGRKVAISASATLKRVHLELCGKAPALVFGDAPLDGVAAELAATGFLNAGQDCPSPCRIIVEDAAYDSFVEANRKAVADLRCGDPEDESSHFGPVISRRQLERVEGFVDRARSTGASVPAGGRRVDRPGWFYEATVITDVRQDDEIIQREIFGPVVTIQRAGSDDEMLTMANSVDYGLAASVWTSRREPEPPAHAGPRVRDRLAQPAPGPRERDAPRRIRAVRLRQGTLGPRHRRILTGQARHAEGCGLMNRLVQQRPAVRLAATGSSPRGKGRR